MLMRTLCRKTIKKGTPNSPMNGGQGVEVSKTLFYALCYAVGAEKALLQAVLRARIRRGKGFIPYPPKPRFYCVTNPQQKE